MWLKLHWKCMKIHSRLLSLLKWKSIADNELISAGLDTAQRFLATNQNAALQTMVNQQNALRTAAAQGLGGAPLILSHHARLQMPSASVTTTLAGTPSAAHVTAAGLINGSLGTYFNDNLILYIRILNPTFADNFLSFTSLFYSPTTTTAPDCSRWYKWLTLCPIRIRTTKCRLCRSSKLLWTDVSSSCCRICSRSNWWVICALTPNSMYLFLQLFLISSSFNVTGNVVDRHPMIQINA